MNAHKTSFFPLSLDISANYVHLEGRKCCISLFSFKHLNTNFRNLYQYNFTNYNFLTSGMILMLYFQGNSWFINLDKLIDYVNNVFQDEDVHLMYSTPSCYLKALQEAEDQDWPSKVGASEQLDSTAHFGLGFVFFNTLTKFCPLLTTYILVREFLYCYIGKSAYL